MNDQPVSEETQLLMKCMLLAFQYYPMNLGQNTSTLGALSESIESILGDPLDGLAAMSRTETNTVHPSYATTSNARDFISECTKPVQKRPYDMTWEQKTAWAFMFGVMLMVAIVGNCIVIWIVLAHREMRTTTNYFLLNLSVADLLMSSLNGVFNFVSMLNSDWPFGSLYCSVNNFMAYVTVATSVFTLVAISFDRYVAIMRPLHRRNSKKKARIFLTTIWALSGVLSFPGLIYSATESKSYLNGKTRTVCYLLWPDGSYPLSAADYIYNIVFLVLTYGIPMLVMVVCYTLMGRELWGSQSIGEHTDRQLESVQAKKKVVRMFIAVVAIFGICWLPYHAFYVYSYHIPSISSSTYVPHLYLGFYWLAMSNSMVNPIIYYWMNRKFRHYFQEVICCFYLWRSDAMQKTQDILLHHHSISMDRRRSCRHNNMVDSKSVRQTDLNNHSPKA